MAKTAVTMEKEFKSLSLNGQQGEPKSDHSSSSDKDQLLMLLLFDPSLLSKEVMNQLPDGYLMRPLSLKDYKKGMMDCLAQLTTVGDVSEKAFIGIYF